MAALTSAKVLVDLDPVVQGNATMASGVNTSRTHFARSKLDGSCRPKKKDVLIAETGLRYDLIAANSDDRRG